MADLASNSIVREEAILDDDVMRVLGITKENDDLFSAAYAEMVGQLPQVKRQLALPKGEPFQYYLLRDPRPKVTVELLKRVLKLITPAHQALLADEQLMSMLHKRHVSDEIVTRYKFCKTEFLYQELNFMDAVNLSLAIHQQFYTILGSGVLHGISIPYTFRGVFLGFATRIVDEQQSKFVKYSFTLPAKMLFNVDSVRDELWLTEGIFDALAFEQAGIPGAVGLGDSQPSPWQLVAASRAAKTIHVALDDDYAGCLGALKADAFLTKLNKPHDFYLLRGDPAEHLLKHKLSITDEFKTDSAGIIERLEEHFDPSQPPISWWDHKNARQTVVDFDE